MTKAMVVLSGGQDSTFCVYWAKQRFDEVHAVTFDYNQKHSLEIESAAVVAAKANLASHTVLQIGPILAGRSPLTNPDEALETYDSAEVMDKVIGDRVELTFVPMRNALFLTLAANQAVCRDILTLVTGVCEDDDANYPDCRRDFIDAQQAMINEALGIDGFAIEAPLIDVPKSDAIKKSLTMPGCYMAFADTHTAYSGEYPPVTQDHATVLRAHAFAKANMPDPLIVRAHLEGLCDLPPHGHYKAAAAVASLMELCDLFEAA